MVKLDMESGGNVESKDIHHFLKRYSVSDHLPDNESSDTEQDVNDTISAAANIMLDPLRDQVGNMGVDVAVLDETLQSLINQTEEANEKIAGVTEFVTELIEKLDDIDDRANKLSEKWTENSTIVSENLYHLRDNTEDITDRFKKFNEVMERQEGQVSMMNGLLEKLEEEMRKYNHTSFECLSKKQSPPTPTTELRSMKSMDELNTLDKDKTVEILKVDDTENIDFTSKMNGLKVFPQKKQILDIETKSDLSKTEDNLSQTSLLLESPDDSAEYCTIMSADKYHTADKYQNANTTNFQFHIRDILRYMCYVGVVYLAYYIGSRDIEWEDLRVVKDRMTGYMIAVVGCVGGVVGPAMRYLDELWSHTLTRYEPSL